MRPTRPAFERPWLTLSWAVVLSACGAQSPPGYDTTNDAGTFLGIGDSGSSGGDDGGIVNGGDAGKLGDDSSDQGDGCSDASRLVYVISDVNDLYSFTPTTLKFAKIGTLACPTSGTVNSMAVDRSGTAWVNYTDGKLYKVSTANAACATTTFAPNQAGFTDVLGMGFSSNAPGSKAETLFVSDNAGLGLGKVDLGTMKLTALGAYTGTESGANAELTGTGDARLYGFFATSPAAYAQVDKASGATPTVIPLTTPGAVVNASDGGYAFSFWGGDFWFYTAYPDGVVTDPTTSVTRYSPASGSASIVLKEIGFVIVGAGVSTCAPVAPPK